MIGNTDADFCDSPLHPESVAACWHATLCGFMFKKVDRRSEKYHGDNELVGRLIARLFDDGAFALAHESLQCLARAGVVKVRTLAPLTFYDDGLVTVRFFIKGTKLMATAWLLRNELVN